MNGKRIPNSKSAHQITPGGTKTKKVAWRHQRSLTSDDLSWPRKGHNVSVNHGCHLPTSIHVHITSINADVRKFQALKRYGTQNSLDMTLEIRSQVKGPSRYGHFQGRCTIVQRIGMQSFVTSGDQFPSYSRKTRGVASTPPPVPASVKVLGQPVTSEDRSKTRKWPKCDFADNFISEQARAAI